MKAIAIVSGRPETAGLELPEPPDALVRADPGWLAQLITRRVTPEAWPLTLRKGPEEIKIVIDMAGTV
jgi:hypothetical protein